ncbi:MAG: cytochrome P460 family protein [Litoreibacter sp.]|nr:cytochrome P460 family protein [Litoreibacter sp.]
MSMKLAILPIACAVAIAGAAFANTLETNERYGAPFVTYVQVERPDGSYRRILTTPDVLEAAEQGQPLPDGTMILMETHYSEGVVDTVFINEKVDGQWQYGSFPGNGTVDLSTRPQASCLSCHSQAAATDFTFTRPSLDAALELGETQITCDLGGRSPCELSHYLESIRE